jgi:hypothetical protein
MDWTYSNVAMRAISAAALAVAAGSLLDEPDRAVLQAPWTQAVGSTLVPGVDDRLSRPLQSGAWIRRWILVVAILALIPLMLFGLILLTSSGSPG